MNSLFSSIGPQSKVAVIAHINPDGDSLGSTMGLALAIKKLGAEVTAFVNDKVPSKYAFIPFIEEARLYDEKEPYTFDYCFVVDCGDQGRLGYSAHILQKSTQVINIDHHVSNTSFGHVNYLDPEAASTCEMVYQVITRHIQVPLDIHIATCLYTGIVTDTGDFRYERTTPETHRIAAALLETGVNLDQIVYHIHQNNSFKSMKLLAALLGSMQSYFDGKLTLMEVSSQQLASFHVAYDEVDGMINYARDIEGVEVAAILKQLNDQEVKASFRSKTDFDVSQLAKHFGGGGHRRAAGAVLKGTIEEAKVTLLNQLKIMM